jgi:hypothetical protein
MVASAQSVHRAATVTRGVADVLAGIDIASWCG